MNQPNIALLVDSPNMQLSYLDDLIAIAKNYGFLSISEIFVNKYVSEKFIELAINKGLKPKLQSIEDIDHALCVRGAEIICSPRYNINMIALAARDGDYVPLVYLARDYGKKTIGIGINGNNMAASLKNSVDYFESVKARDKPTG